MTKSFGYVTPPGFDNMIMLSDGNVLTGLYFEASEDVSKHPQVTEEEFIPVFRETKRWLDIYFSGRQPDFTPTYRVLNSTPFRQRVDEIMLRIPYGTTVTYGEIAGEIARERGIERMSAQAVGGAVGSNPVCIIIPCHRVMGSGGSLTGYGGGIKNKASLLKLEGIDVQLPKGR